MFVGGSAVKVGAERTVVAAQTLAAKELEAAAGDIEYRDGVFSIAGTDRRIGLFELARRQPQHKIVLDSVSSVADATWPNGCHICEVEIDPETGAVAVVAYWSVNDVGRVVNPMIVVGQLEGGAAQGIGQALCEQFVYDRESGQALSATLLDYALPRATMIEHFEMTMDESTPCRNNAMGVKGVGELGTIGATPAVVNAVIDALARAGVGAPSRSLADAADVRARLARARRPKRLGRLQHDAGALLAHRPHQQLQHRVHGARRRYRRCGQGAQLDHRSDQARRLRRRARPRCPARSTSCACRLLPRLRSAFRAARER